MQDEYSVEEAKSRILDPRIKKYFDEVLLCYQAGCYRSCVIALWSVAICDLFFKLQKLAEQYDNQRAKKILEDANELHKGEAYPAVWEKKFLESIKNNTEFLDDIECNKLLYLQKMRNLAAHPAIEKHSELLDSKK